MYVYVLECKHCVEDKVKRIFGELLYCKYCKCYQRVIEIDHPIIKEKPE